MKYYKMQMTNGAIKIDQADLDKFIQVSKSGNFVKLKKGIVNPSFVINIIPISAREALEGEPQGNEMKGKLDEKKGVYILEKPTKLAKEGLQDEFKM